MGEDGACLFRAVSDQVYGDQEMHSIVRKHCMDYIVSGPSLMAVFVIILKRNANVVLTGCERGLLLAVYDGGFHIVCESEASGQRSWEPH